MRSRRSRLSPRQVTGWLILPVGLFWVACLELEADPIVASDASNDSPADVDASSSKDTGAAGSGSDASLDSSTSDVTDVVVIDPFDAPDGFEASGPPPPATCASSGFQCVTPAPSGWAGPFSLYEGNVASAPSCGNVTQMLAANSGLVAPGPAQCAACQCNSVTGASCGPVAITPKRGNCTGTGFATNLGLNVCTQMSYGTFVDEDGFAANALGFGASMVSGGACTPTLAKPVATQPAVSWSTAAVGCTTLVPTTPGCTGSKVCSAIPEPPFNAKLCIGSDGDIPGCPGAPYSRRVVYYKGVADSRDCGACGCTAPAGGQCITTVSTSTDSTCATNENVGTAPVCLAREPGFYFTRATAVLPAMSCPPTGGAPTGTATAASPVTVCCEP